MSFDRQTHQDEQCYKHPLGESVAGAHRGYWAHPSNLIPNQVPEHEDEVVEVVNPNQQQGGTQRRFCNDRLGQAATIRLATGASDTKRGPYQSRDAVSHPHGVIT